jgi:hypothetical protein
VLREAQEVLSLYRLGPWQRIVWKLIVLIFFGWLPNIPIFKRKEGERKGEDEYEESNKKSCPFGKYIKKQHLYFLVQGHSSWSTFGLHLVRGPKA